MLTIIHQITFGLMLIPLFMGGYLLCLTLFAWFVSWFFPAEESEHEYDYLFLIPAHNEEELLPKTLSNLLTDLNYNPNRYEIAVIADNCTDQTADKARECGVTVLERINPDQKGKGFALTWGLDQCRTAEKSPDAIIILDADTIVSPNFLKVISHNLAQGNRIVQPFYSVLNATESWSASLRYAALSVLHYVRPQGRRLYGGSAGLKGNGMVFAREILESHQWSASITEDIEYHMDLLLAGEVVHFAPNATVWAEMPNTIEASATQNQRWETGRLEMAKNYVPKLLRAAFSSSKKQKRNTIAQLDAVMEHIIPPFAIFNGVSLGFMILCTTLFLLDPLSNVARFNLFAALFLLFIQTIYLFSGLFLTNAESRVYKNLLYVPFYIIWKILLAIRIVSNQNEKNWVRTARNESP